MRRCKKVSELNPGDEGLIEELLYDACNHLRLQEMGILPGRSLRLTRRAPLGTPYQIDVEGSAFLLSSDEASSVLVRLN